MLLCEISGTKGQISKTQFAVLGSWSQGTSRQSCPWVGLTHGLGWVEIFQFLVGWVGSTITKVLKILKDYFNAFKAWLDKIWLHQAVKFDFMAYLTGTGNE